jgi:hypothetical protein
MLGARYSARRSVLAMIGRPVNRAIPETGWDLLGSESADGGRREGASPPRTATQNVLIAEDRAVMVDWPRLAWSNRVPPWLDPALSCIWPIASGKHESAQAEQCASRMPAWHRALPDAMNALAQANATLWAEIADENHGPDRPRCRTQSAAFRSRTTT